MVTICHNAEHIVQPLQRIERKFFVLPRNIGYAYNLLRLVCRPAREYPLEQINSLYFDTEDLEQYEKSSSGDSRKDKVRIRWYHQIRDYQDTVPVFVELKSREGFTGAKQREQLTVPIPALEVSNLHEGIIPNARLADIVAGFGHFPSMPIHPIILISYWRYRLTEPLTGMIVSLDYNIRSTVIYRSLGYGETELRLPGAVIEVKGSKLELPATLLRLKLLDLDWSRFSKYSSCLDSNMIEPGTFSRLAPSGRIFET